MAEVHVCCCRIEHRHAEVTCQVHVSITADDETTPERNVYIETIHRSQLGWRVPVG